MGGGGCDAFTVGQVVRSSSLPSQGKPPGSRCKATASVYGATSSSSLSILIAEQPIRDKTAALAALLQSNTPPTPSPAPPLSYLRIFVSPFLWLRGQISFMAAEDSDKTAAQCLCSDAVRCSLSGTAGHASIKRFIPVGGWPIMEGTEMCRGFFGSAAAFLSPSAFIV